MIWPCQDPEENLFEFYGDPGENQVRVKTPYPLVIAWDTSKTVHSFLCHELVKSSLERIFAQALKHYGLASITALGLNIWGGCLNIRPMTGNPDRLTLHSWGIALDWHPTQNRYGWNKKKALFAQPIYNAWWDIWEAEGWTSLGRAIDNDWMHVQAASLL